MRTLAACGMLVAGFAVTNADAYTLWSTPVSYLGTGEFHGPGANDRNDPLFATVIRNMMFETAVDVVAPFSNNGNREPNVCARPRDEKLADGTLINENVDMCAATIGGLKVVPAAVQGGPLQGELTSATLENGDVIMTMDFAMDFSASGQGIVHMPFYGTTGEVEIPKSLQSQMGANGVDQAGRYASGTKLRGRIGDFNHDGWIDGTILTTGVMPLDSKVAPGQPFLMVRNFETDIPIDGQRTGDIKSLRELAVRRTND